MFPLTSRNFTDLISQWCECENPLWGLTTHPLNPKFTSGGSSGGEGALLALNGSLIGWGTDIGGSIRIPSHMNGLWGLKPSVGFPAPLSNVYVNWLTFNKERPL